MSVDTIHVLLIEDNPADARLVEHSLRCAGTGTSFELTHAEGFNEARSLLPTREINVVVVDLDLVETQGHETFAQARRLTPGIPLVVLTSDTDEVLGARLVKEGAQDFLVKGELLGYRIGRSLVYAVERHRAEQERANLAAVVAASERVLGVVGHELRTPLAAIRAISELILSNGVRMEDLPEYMENIHRQSVQLAHMVNELLEVARLNSGTARWNWEQVDVRAACSAAIASVKPLIQPDKVALTFRVEPPDLAINGDPDAVRRLVLNLVQNSCKFTSHGSVSVLATPHEEDGLPYIDIRVQDTGKGIEPQLAASLGRAFVLNSGVVGEEFVNGSGLGLAICKGIAAAHGGALTVESIPGIGTTITARLRADLAGPAPTGAESIVVKQRDNQWPSAGARVARKIRASA